MAGDRATLASRGACHGYDPLNLHWSPPSRFDARTASCAAQYALLLRAAFTSGQALPNRAHTRLTSEFRAITDSRPARRGMLPSWGCGGPDRLCEWACWWWAWTASG